MPKTIYKKFERSKIPLARQIVIQPRDVEIFKSLAENRFLDSKQIIALFPGSGGPRYFLKRLQQLFHHGYIDRPPSQMSYYRTRGQMIYALGNKGADVIYKKDPRLRGRIDWQQKNRIVKFPFLDHAMMISDFWAALTLALRERMTKDIKLAAWRQDEKLKDYVVSEGKKTAVFPDAFFTLEFPNAPEDQKLAHFFLEADRSTMEQERFLSKMKAYWQWWKRGGHKRKFGINRFRVLTITISEERKKNLRETIKQADEKKQGSEMFLFTCEKNYNLDDFRPILKPIWQSPKNDEYHHLLE